LCTRFRACFLLHSSIQPDKDHLIASSGFASALISDRAGDSVRAHSSDCNEGKRHCKKEHLHVYSIGCRPDED